MIHRQKLILYELRFAFHKLGHFQLGTRNLGQDAWPSEVYGWHKCIRVIAEDGLAMSYELYLACNTT